MSMYSLIYKTYRRIPQRIRRVFWKIIPHRLAEVLAEYSLIFRQNIDVQSDSTGTTDVRRTLFDHHWYSSNYDGVPQSRDAAWSHFITIGAQQGHRPSAMFSPVIPKRARVPVEHMMRVVGSPILSRVAATKYLSLFQVKTSLHSKFQTMDEYLRISVVCPDLIKNQIWENDLRIIGIMDRRKNKLREIYLSRPQVELVTVVMPTRDRADIIADSIVSVIMQSYQNWELVVVDDAGSDEGELRRVIDSFSDDRIVYIRQTESVGNGLARNAGLRIARGSVVAHMDDDDQWDPDHLLILLNQMRDAGARAAYGAQAVWVGFDEKLRLGNVFRCVRFAPFNRSLLENTNYISMIAMIHDRSLLDQVGVFSATLRRYLDWEFFLRLTEVSAPLAVPCITSHYYQKRKKTSVSSIHDGEVAIRAFRYIIQQRASWSHPFQTSDGSKHILTSTAGDSQIRRRSVRHQSARPVTIVIPNYDSLYELGVCLEMIAKHTLEEHSVVVVDNGSSPEVVDAIAALVGATPHASLIHEAGNAGFTHAVNAGLQRALSGNSDILILNNDAIVTPDWLCELQHVLAKHDSVGLAVPQQVTLSRNSLIKTHVPGGDDRFECDVNLSMHHRNVIDAYFDPSEGLMELAYAPLFCGLIRHEVAQLIGSLDAANGPHFRSDWLLADDLRRAGHKIVHTPHSKVYHLHGVATARRKLA